MIVYEESKASLIVRACTHTSTHVPAVVGSVHVVLVGEEGVVQVGQRGGGAYWCSLRNVGEELVCGVHTCACPWSVSHICIHICALTDLWAPRSGPAGRGG